MSIVWSHGVEELGCFLAHLNGVHPHIQFTMEREINNWLAFLDVLVLLRSVGSLAHKVYRKPMHTDISAQAVKSEAEMGSAEDAGGLGKEDLQILVS